MRNSTCAQSSLDSSRSAGGNGAVRARAATPATSHACRTASGWRSRSPSPVSLARQERDIAARETTQARAGFLPQSRLVNGFTYNSPLLYNREMFSFLPLNGIREYAFLFSVDQEFDTSGRLRADLARARVARDLAGTSLALTERDLRRAVTTAYYRALLTRRIARIVQDALAESQSFEKRTKLLFEGGEAAQADVVKASAQTAFLEQALNAAELEAKLASQELASFWTRDVAEPLSLADVWTTLRPLPRARPRCPRLS